MLKVITDGDIGKWVEYQGHNYTQKGRMKSFNDKWVFVVFHCDGNWDNYRDYTGCACDPGDLKWTTPLESQTNES